MSIESTFMSLLENATAPELVRATKSYGYTPADDEKVPTVLPLLVLQRTQSEFITDMCQTYQTPFVSIALVHLARGAQEARQQAQAAALVLLNSADKPALETETEEYDPDARCWLVTQSYRVFDDHPAI